MNAETPSLVCYAIAALCIVCAVMLIRRDIRRSRERAAINRRLDRIINERRGKKLAGERAWRDQCR